MPAQLRRYDQAGDVHCWTISCFQRLTFFWHDALKRVAVEGLRALQTRFGVCVIGYVVTPEHVHVILLPHARGQADPIPISTLLHAYKQHVGFHGKEELRDVWRECGALWSEPLNAWARGGYGRQPLWTTRAYDFNIRTEESLLQKLEYCHKNPITRGLVERAEDWPWSSHRFYESDDRSLLAMDWDRAWPIVW